MRLRVLVLLLAVLGGAAACSSGGNPSTSPSPGGTIVIGNIGAYTGSQAANVGPGRAVLQAFVKQANAAGGIDGHQIKLIVTDVGDSQSAGLLAAKQMITQDHVVAIVADSDLASSNWASYVESAGVPVIGGIPIESPFLSNPDFFSSGANVVSLYYGIEEVAKTHGGRMGLLYCAESPICAQVVGLAKAIAAQTGVQIVTTAEAAASSPDYTSQCQALKSAKVDSYLALLGGPVQLRLVSDCLKAGVTAKPIVVDGSVDNTWLSNPSVNGATIVGASFPYFDDSTASTKAYQALRKSAGLTNTTSNENGAYTYAAMKLFQTAVMHTHGTVTAASLKTALYGLKNETLGGLSGPVSYTEGKPSTAQCYFEYGIAAGKFTEPNGLATHCVPAAAMSAILATVNK